MLDAAWFARPVEAVAEALVGCTLLLEDCGGLIVETEAYHHGDPASHSFRGRTARNAPMFGPVGHLYVYRSYGMHWCANIVAGTEPGSAVLLRALEPTRGLEAMRARRGLEAASMLCSGPGKLTEALGITGAMNGAPLTQAPFALLPRTGSAAVVADRRIGISKGVETPWRFLLGGSRYVSRRVAAPVSAAGERRAGKASRR